MRETERIKQLQQALRTCGRSIAIDRKPGGRPATRSRTSNADTRSRRCAKFALARRRIDQDPSHAGQGLKDYLRELRHYGAKNAAAKRTPCSGLRVTQPSATSTKVVVPRRCLTKAADKLRFQGIVTEGLSSSDETNVNKAVGRG